MSVIVDGTSGVDTVQKAALVGKLPAGTVLQVVSTNYSTLTSSASTTWVDSGVTASITPSSSTSKILVIVNCNGAGKSAANSANALGLRLLRGSTTISGIDTYFADTNSALQIYASSGITYLDSPATTSSTTYKVQISAMANAGTVYINNYYNTASEVNSTMTLMEIAA
jgi:hypothetical protein